MPLGDSLPAQRNEEEVQENNKHDSVTAAVSNGQTTSQTLTTCRLRLRTLFGGEGFRVFQLPAKLVSDHVTHALKLTFTEYNTMLIVRGKRLW